jgi:hypothetical protein
MRPDHAEYAAIVQDLRIAMASRKARILFMGGHTIKLGLSRFLTDLIKADVFTHVAVNGACLVHDFELHSHGETSEEVQKYIKEGQFGLWEGTSELNHSIADYAEGGADSAGRCVAEAIHELCQLSQTLTDTSVLATCLEAGIPITAHLLIGGDINHSHRSFDPRLWGEATYNDFLAFAESVKGLHDGGVLLNVGSAVHGPEIFLKSLSMVRNVQPCTGFTTGVFDCVALPHDWRNGVATKEDPLYYWRPWKTLLVRTTGEADSRSHYVQGDFRVTLPELWSRLMK